MAAPNGDFADVLADADKRERRSRFNTDRLKYIGYAGPQHPNIYWDPVVGKWTEMRQVQHDASLPTLTFDLLPEYEELMDQWMTIPGREGVVWNPRTRQWMRRIGGGGGSGTTPPWLSSLDKDLANLEAARSRMTPDEYHDARRAIFARYF